MRGIWFSIISTKNAPWGPLVKSKEHYVKRNGFTKGPPESRAWRNPWRNPSARSTMQRDHMTGPTESEEHAAPKSSRHAPGCPLDMRRRTTWQREKVPEVGLGDWICAANTIFNGAILQLEAFKGPVEFRTWVDGARWN